MKILPCMIWLFSGFFFTSVTVATPALPEVVLGTNVSSAYAAQYTANIRGGSIEHVECIFARLQQPQRIVSMPWRRAHQEVRTQNIDAFFTTMLLGEADSSGVYSAPLVLENWYWFWRADTPEAESWKDKHKLGVILGSPQAVWLKRENYSAPMAANNLPQLLKLLFSKRVDVILADKEHFDKAAAELDVVTDSFNFRFFRYAPLGVFFGKHFITSQPDFLEKFNHHIYHCAPDGFQVSEYERQKIKEKVLPWMHEWMVSPGLTRAVVEQNKTYRHLVLEDMLISDSLWQREFSPSPAEFSLNLLKNSLSHDLRQFKTKTAGLVTEIIVMDERGFNVGISDMTSDYWQGDEDKYLQIFNRPADTLFFDAVLFDESTRRFQVQLSLQLYQPGNPQAIGVMTVALDIEKILSLNE